MTPIRQIILAPLGDGLCLAAMLLLLLQIFVLLLSLRQKRGLRFLLLCAAHVLFGLCLLALLLDGTYRLEYLPYEREYPAAVRFVGSLPWLAVAGVELVSALLLAAALRSALRFARSYPAAMSVKQAVDLLPAGVCVSAADGTVLLSNLRMNEYRRLLTGSDRSDADTLLAAVDEHGEEQGGKRLLRLDDGTVLLVERSETVLDGQRYTQLFAEDVTEQYRITAELESKNARLHELQQRMKTYQCRETELVIRQELLSARTTVHNQLGGALLTGKYHLEHPQSTDAEALRLLLTQINTYLLSEAEDVASREDELESALRQAEGIGVQVAFTGELPASGPLRELLAQAVTECAANAVKHAGGDCLTVTLQERSFTVENNGKPPEREIVPSGGLSSLRLAAEQAGGSLTLQSSPRFRLTVTL